MGGPMICPLMGPKGDVRVYAVSGGARKMTEEEQEANARLIAAAPSMLSALEEVQSLLYSADNAEGDMKTQCIRKAFGIARNAVQAATAP
jgi:hypothetical protein